MNLVFSLSSSFQGKKAGRKKRKITHQITTATSTSSSPSSNEAPRFQRKRRLTELCLTYSAEKRASKNKNKTNLIEGKKISIVIVPSTMK